MTAAVDICNMALSNLGARSRIASLTEQSEEARHCLLWYAASRDATLQAADWNFARKRAALATVDGASVDDWAYVYAYPSGCLQARRIATALRAVDPPPFEVATLTVSGTDYICILTDEPEAVLVYTRPVENPNLFSPRFIVALSWALAANIALPITGKTDLARVAAQQAQGWIGAAETSDANEQGRDAPREASWVEAR
jgi:hypothetical protein